MRVYPVDRVAARCSAWSYVLLALLVAFTSCVQSASLRVDVAAFAQTAGVFEAYVDTRQLSPPLDVLSVTLQIQCRTQNGQATRIWVPFTDRLLSRGSLFVKTIQLPSPCVTWDRLVDAKVPLALGKADGPDAQVGVGQGAIQGHSVPLDASRLAPAGEAMEGNRILGLRVRSDQRDRLVIEIDYFYSGNWGNAGWLSAAAKNTSQPNRHVTYFDTQGCAENNAAKRGRQTTCMRLLGATPNVMARTDVIEVCLFNGMGSERRCRNFPYVKQWY